MARPGDWSPLGLGGDPTPGDPEVVDGIVNYMKLIQTAATEADQGINNIMSGTGDGAFVGKTADWLREEIESKTKTFLAAVADAFETAAPAMSTYAQKLRDAQASADNALSQAQGLAEDDSRRETLKQQAEQAKSDLEGAATTASSAVDSVAHATNPWAKSACEQFWDAFFWIVLLITVVAIFVGGPLGLIAFALNVVLAVKEIVDFAQGKGSIGELLLSLVGVLFPSTRALKLGDLVSSIKSATAAIAKGTWAGVKGLGNDLANIFRNLSWSGITKNVTDLGNVVITSVKAGAAWIPKAVVGAGAFAHGLVALPKTTISAVSSGFVNGLGKLAGAGITKINGAIDAFLKTKFVQLMKESLGGWQALRIFLPMAGHEIRGLGVLNAFKVGVLGRGLNISSFKNMTLIDKLGDTVQIVKGITMTSGGVYDAWSKVMKPELITPGGSAGGLGDAPAALPRPIMEMPPIRQSDVLSRMPDLDTSLLRGPNGDFGSVKIGNNTTIADLNGGTWHVNDANTSFSSTPSGIQVPNSAFSSLGDVGGADLRQFGSIDAIANAGAHVSTPGLGDVGAGLSKLVLPGNFGNVGDVGAGLGSVKIPGIAEGLGGAGAVGSLKAIGDLDVLTKVGNLNQLGDLNKVGGTAQITDGNVTLRGGDLRLVDGNGASISLADLKITNGSGVSFDLNGVKLTDGVASVAPTGLRVDAGAGTGSMRFTDGAASVDVSKLQITHGNTSLGLTDLKFTNGTGTTFDLHSLKLSDGVNSVDLGADLRIVDSAGGSVSVNGGALNNIPVNGIGGLTDHLSTPGGLQSLLGLDQTAALHNMQSMFPGAAGVNAGAGGVNPVSLSGGSFAGASGGSAFGGNAFGSIHNAKLHADLSDFAFRELPKIMDNEFQIIKKTDESVQISLSDDAISHIGGHLGAGGGAVKLGQAGPAPIEMPTVRADGSTLNAGPARQPVVQPGGGFAESQVARIEAPGVNRVEDALAQLADVDVPRRVDTPDSLSAHTPDVDSAGSSLGPRPDLAGGEVTTPHVDSAVPLRDGQPLAVTPEGRVVDPAAGPGGARPESPSTIESVPAPHWADDPLAEVKHLADRLFPNQVDAVVTYQAAQGLLHQAQAAKAAGLQAGDGAHVAAQQVNDIVVAERLLAKAEENLAAQGLSGAQVDARMAELDAGDLKFAEAKVEIEIATQKQIDAVRGSADSPGPVALRDDELFASPEAFDPKKALGLDDAQWRSLDKAQADLNFSNTKFDADTLRATLDSLGIDPADYQKFVQARDVGPSAIQAYKESGGFGAFGATDDQIRNALKQLPGDQRLVQALRDDPSFSDFREVFKGLWQDFAAKAGGDVDLAADRLKFVQWQSDPLRPGNLPPGLEASDLARIFRDRDGAVSPGGAPKDLPAVPGRELDPPGGVSMDGLAKVWNDAVDKFRASVQNLEHSPGTNIEIEVMLDDTLREIAEGLPEAFARQARFEDELLTSLPKFDEVVADTKGNASWGNGIDDGVVDRARIDYVGELRNSFNQTVRDLDIRFTGRGGDEITPGTDPKLQSMRDELFGGAGTGSGSSAPYRGIGDYPAGLEHFADTAALNKALTDDAFKNWSAKVDEIADGVPDRLRFENEAGDTLDDAGRRFHDMADGADVEPKLLDAIGTDYREKLAVAFHDAYGAGGSRRGWLDHEQGHGDAFGGGRSAQADWRSSQADWRANQAEWRSSQADGRSSQADLSAPRAEDASSAAGNPGHSALESPGGGSQIVDEAGSFKVEPVQDLVPVPKPVEIKPSVAATVDNGIHPPRPATDQAPQFPRSHTDNEFSSGRQLYDNPAAAIDHDVAILEVRFAEAGVPQSVSDSILGGFRVNAEGLAHIHQASGHSLDAAMRAGVQYAGSVSAPVNLGLAYQQLLKTPQAWAGFHQQVEVTAHRLESKVLTRIDAADLTHLSPAEQAQVRIDALGSVADGVNHVFAKLYSTPGSIFTRIDGAGAYLGSLGARVDGVLEQVLAGPPPAPHLSSTPDIAKVQVGKWADNLLAHADARFDRLGDAPYRQDLITQAQNEFTAGLGRAVDDIRVLLDTPSGPHLGDGGAFAVANVRLNELNTELLGQLRQGLTDAHITPLNPGQILGDLVTGRTNWAQAMIDALPGSPALKSLEILTLDGRTLVRPIGTDHVLAPGGPGRDLDGVLHIEPTVNGQVPGLAQVADLIEALPPILRPHDFVVHPGVPFTAEELRVVLGVDPVDATVAVPPVSRIEELTDENLRANFELKTFATGLAATGDLGGWWKEQEFLAGALVSGLAAGVRAELTDLARHLVFRQSGDWLRPSHPDPRQLRLDSEVVPVTAALLGANLRVGGEITADLVQPVRSLSTELIGKLDLRQPDRLLGGAPNWKGKGKQQAAPQGQGRAQLPEIDRASPFIVKHPGYATGDQWSVLATLLHNPHAQVALGRPALDAVSARGADTMSSIYHAAGVGDRVIQVPMNALDDFGKALKKHPDVDLGRIVPLNYGTKYVTKYQAEFGGNFRDTFKQALRIDPGSMAGRNQAIGEWLAGKGIRITPDTEVLVLWTRFSGKKGNAHLEHDTSLTGIGQLLDGLKASADRPRVVVLAGDRRPEWGTPGQKPRDHFQQLADSYGDAPNFRVADLTEFWTDATSHPLIKPGANPFLSSDARLNQFGIYEFLHQNGNLQHLGFRSGNLEAFVLSGHKVSYLEENLSFSSGRMKAWNDLGYRVLELERAPTASGQLYKVDELAVRGVDNPQLVGLMESTSDALYALDFVVKNFDARLGHNQIAKALREFRDSGFRNQNGQWQNESRFDNLWGGFEALRKSPEWDQDVIIRVRPEDKPELVRRMEDFARQLGWHQDAGHWQLDKKRALFDDKAGQRDTVENVRELSRLLDPLSKDRSAWLVKLRADLLDGGQAARWQELKAPFAGTRGFTDGDLTKIGDRLAGNWADGAPDVRMSETVVPPQPKRPAPEEWSAQQTSVDLTRPLAKRPRPAATSGSISLSDNVYDKVRGKHDALVRAAGGDRVVVPARPEPAYVQTALDDLLANPVPGVRADSSTDLAREIFRRWANENGMPNYREWLPGGAPSSQQHYDPDVHGSSSAPVRLTEAQLLSRSDVPFLITHQGMATGDQWGILATLLHNPEARVVLGMPMANGPDAAMRPLAESVRDFYQATNVMDRVTVMDVWAMGDLTKTARTVFPAANQVSVTFGTRYVEQFAEDFGAQFKSALRIDSASMDVRGREIGEWLHGKGISPTSDTEVLVLWSRFSGKKGKAHVEHDTSLTGVEQLLSDLRRTVTPGRERIVVIAGDRHPDWGTTADGKPVSRFQERGDHYRTADFKVVDLSEFWKDPSAAHLITPGPAHLTSDARVNQLGVFEYLNLHANTQHLGFRSGNLEAFVLSGHKVSYLEEPGSISADRMQRWAGLGVNREINPPHDPGREMRYARLQVDRSPTLSGQIYKLDEWAAQHFAQSAKDAHTSLGYIFRIPADFDQLAAGVRGFRDSGYLNADGEWQWVSGFNELWAKFGDFAQNQYAPYVMRLTPSEKADLPVQLRQLADHLGWDWNAGRWDEARAGFAHDWPALRDTLQTMRRVDDLVKPFGDLQSSWMADKLRPAYLQGGKQAWHDFKTSFGYERGFTPNDLDLIRGQLRENWTGQHWLGGQEQRAGRLLSDELQVRAHFPEIRSVNPDLARGGEFATNCVISYITMSIALREGEAFQAPPSELWSHRELMAWQRQQLGLDDAAQPKVFRTGSLDDIRAAMLKAGEGSQAALVFDLPEQGFGHVVNVVTRDGQVWFLDAQAGGAAVLPHGVDELEFWPMSSGIADLPGARPVPASDLTDLPWLGTLDQDQLLAAPGVPFLLTHQGMATGDQWGIMATLLHNPNAHVALGIPAANGPDAAMRPLAESIRDFYHATGVMDQVTVMEVGSMGELTRAAKNQFPHLQPVSLTFGTRYVERFAEDFGEQFKSALRIDTGSMDVRGPAIGEWLRSKGVTVTPNTETLVLWSRFSGKNGKAHIEHDTSLTGVRQLLSDLQANPTPGRDRVVVIAGDRPKTWGTGTGKPVDYYQQLAAAFSGPGFRVADLTEFWKDPSAAHLITPGPAHLSSDARVNQLGVYEYLHLNSRVQHLGFRSGNLEAFVLSGHHVTYLEEPASISTDRMQRWADLGVNPDINPAHDPGRAMRYSLLVMDKAPTRAGQIYKLDERATQGFSQLAKDTHASLAYVFRTPDAVAGVRGFRDSGYWDAHGEWQWVSGFNELWSGFERFANSPEWGYVLRLNPAEKAGFGTTLQHLAGQLGWDWNTSAWDEARAAFTTAAGLAETLWTLQRLDGLLQRLASYQSAWMSDLRAGYLQDGGDAGKQAWKQYKASSGYQPGFTTNDLELIRGQLRENWTGRRWLAGGEHRIGQPLGNDELVRARFPEIRSVNPQLALGGEFSTNCVISYITMSIALREGEAFQAPPSEMWSQQELMAWQRQQLGLADDAQPRVLRTTELDGIRAVMLRAGEGAQAALVFDVPTQSFGHVVNVVTRDGEVWFLDAQAGGAAVLPHGVSEVEFWPMSAQIADPEGARALAADELTDLPRLGMADQAELLDSYDKPFLITHPGMATGDQWGILATLLHNPNAHVALGIPASDGPDAAIRPLAKSIRDFYRATGVGDQVTVMNVRTIGELTRSARATFPQADQVSVTFGTRYVERFAEDFGGRFKEALRIDPVSMAARGPAIGQWLQAKGIHLTPQTEVLVLWSRFSGKKGKAHIEHDTSLTGVAQLLGQLSGTVPGGRRRLVVIAGDRHPDWGSAGGKSVNHYQEMADAYFNRGGNFQVADLTEFWKDRSAAHLITPGPAHLSRDARVNQLGVYEYLNLFAHTQHLGFRSGNLEAFVLSGHKVSYLEEPGSISTDRMQRWANLGVNPDINPAHDPGRAMRYSLLVMDNAPTRSGQLYKLDEWAVSGFADSAKAAHASIAYIQRLSSRDVAGRIEAVRGFRDSGYENAHGQWQWVSGFTELYTDFGRFTRSEQWQSVLRLNPAEKQELSEQLERLADQLGWDPAAQGWDDARAVFDTQAGLRDTLHTLARVDQLVARFGSYQSAWMSDLRATYRQGGKQAWRDLKAWYQTRPGFTARDLGLISEQLADNWGTRYGIAGLGEGTGRLLGDDAEVRVYFPEVRSVNPGRARGGEFATNCVISFITLSISFREGGRFQAPPSEMWSQAELAAWQRQQLGLADDALPQVLRTGSLEQIHTAMLSSGEGAQAALVFDVPGRGFGHVINVVTRGGRVWFLDAQAGGAALLPDGVTRFEFWPMSASVADAPGVQAVPPADLTPLPRLGSAPMGSDPVTTSTATSAPAGPGLGSTSVAFELQNLEPIRPVRVQEPTTVTPAVLDTVRSTALIDGLRQIADRLPMGLDELSAARVPLAAEVVQKLLVDTLLGDAEARALLAGLDRVARLSADGTLAEQMDELAGRGAQSFDTAVGRFTGEVADPERLRGLAENLAWAPFVADRFDDVLRSADVDPQHERIMSGISGRVEEQIDPQMVPGPGNADWVRLVAQAGADLVPELAEALVLVSMVRDLSRLAAGQDAAVLTRTTRDVVDRLATDQLDQVTTTAQLPSGFAETPAFPVAGAGLVAGGPQFAFGPGGRAESFGGQGFTEPAFVARATDFTPAPAPATLAALQEALTGHIAEFGATTAVHSMLEGGLEISAVGHTLTLRLQDVDRAGAQRVRPSQQPLLRSGETAAGPMDKLVARSTAISQEFSRTGTFDASLFVSIGQGNLVLLPYGGLNASSTTSRSLGFTLDSSTTETVSASGQQVYFDLPARLVAEIRVSGKRAVKHRGAHSETLRVAFPEKVVAHQPAPGEWFVGSERAPLTGALAAVMPGIGAVGGFGFLNQALVRALSPAGGSEPARVIEHRMTETGLRAELPRTLGTKVPQAPLPWTKGRSLVTHAGAEVLAVRRLGPPVEVPVQLDKGGGSSQFSAHGNAGTFGLTAGLAVSPAPLGTVAPYVAIGFPLGTGRGVALKNGLAAGSGVKVASSGPSVPYQVQVRYTLSAETLTAGQTKPGEMPADLKADLGVTVYVAEELAPLFERALHELSGRPLPTTTADAAAEAGPVTRYAPLALSKPTGPAGFAGTLGLTGAQNLVRQFTALLGQVESTSRQTGRAGQGPVRVDEWTRSQQLDLQDWLLERFDEPDLRQGQEEMFASGGRSETYLRELNSGDVQHITFGIAARRTSPVPADSVAVKDASIALKPNSGFETTHSGADTTSTGVTVGSRWNWSVPIPGTGRRFIGRIAVNSSAARGHTDTVDVLHSGSVTKPLAYSGPAWVYRYPSEVTLTVEVTRVLSRDISAQIVQALESGARKLVQRPAPELQAATRARFGALAAWMVPEPFTTLENPLAGDALTEPPAPVATPGTELAPSPPLALDKVDHQLRRFAAGTEAGTHTGTPDRATSSWWKFSSGWVFSPLSDPYGTVGIRPIDRVRHVEGVVQLRAALVEQLAAVGIDRSTARVWALANINQDHLRGLFVREATGQAGNVSQKLTFGDREAQYALIPVVHGVTDDGTSATFETGVSLEYASSATFSAASTATFGIDANARFGVSVVREKDAFGNPAGGGAHVRFGPSFAQADTWGTVQALSRAGGQSVKMDLKHTGRTGTVRWRIIVLSARNLTESRRLDQHLGVRAAATDVDIAEGIQFYAPERTTFTLADLESLITANTSTKLPELRKDEPRRLRADAEPESGLQRFGPLGQNETERVVPMAPLSDTDPTLVPEYPVVPLNSVPEYLLSRPGADPLSRANPVLQAAGDLLAQYEPGALTGAWKLQTAGTTMRGGLDVMLSPQALNAQAAVLRAGGLMLTRVDGRFLGQRVTQLLIRLNRDPRHRGYLRTEGHEGTVGFTNRGDERTGQSWSTARTINLSAGLTGIVDGVARPSFQQTQFVAELARGWNTGSGGSYAFAPMRYDGFETTGEISMLTGEVEIEVTLISVWRPSPLLNTLGLGAPMSLSRHAQKVTAATPSGTAATVGRKVVPLGESVVAPTADLIRPLPAGTGEPIISRLAPGPLPAGVHEVSFTGAELRGKDIVFRIDPDKVRHLYDAWTRALEKHAGAPALLAAWGQIGQDELRALSDPAVLENHLLKTGTGASGADTRLPVPLRSTGSVLTDTTGRLSVSFRLVAPKVTARFPAAQVSGKADVMTMNSTPAGRQDLAGSARGGAPNQYFSGNPPQAPLAQNGGQTASVTPLGIAAPMYSGKTKIQAGGSHRAAGNWDAWSMNTTWFGPVHLDALVTITLTTRNERDKIGYGGTELPLTFRVRNLFEAAWSPLRLVRDAGLRDWATAPVPVKVPSGWYLPADAHHSSSARELDAMQAFPAIDDPGVAVIHTAFRAPQPPIAAEFAVHQPPVSSASFRVYGEDVSPADFAGRYLSPIVQHDPRIRVIVLVSDSLPTGTRTMDEVAGAAGLPTGIRVVAVTGPLATPFGELRVDRPEGIAADARIHSALDAQNTWEIVTTGESGVRTVRSSMPETVKELLDGLPVPEPVTTEPRPSAPATEVPAPGPDDLHHTVLRQRLTQLAGSTADLTAARTTWWAGLAAQAEQLVNNFEPVAVAPLSFVANSMVNNRLAVAEGAADLGDEAREKIRSGLAVVLLAALLKSWSAQGGTGLPTREMVRPVAELADDLIPAVFDLGRPDPSRAPVQPTLSAPVPVVPVVIRPSGHITATGDDVLGALLAGPSIDQKPVAGEIPVHAPTSSSTSESPDPATPASPQPPPAPTPTSPITPEPHTTARTDAMPDTPAPQRPVHSTPGLVGPVKTPDDLGDPETQHNATLPSAPSPLPSDFDGAVAEAFALLASGAHQPAEGER